MITRRVFLNRSALSFFGITSSGLFLGKNLIAGQATKRGKIFVLIFQRGAMDGLSMVPPIGDTHYLEGRPNIALKAPGETPPLSLDGFFGLHPSLSALKKYWDEGTLLFVPQSGSPNSTRSHFDAQDYMESGTPGNKNTQEGFLNRAMVEIPPDKQSPVRAVAMQPNMPRILAGPFPAISMNSVHDFAIRTDASSGKEVEGFETMYQQATDRVFRGVGSEAFDALKTVREAASKDGKTPHSKDDAGYPKAALGKRLREIAELIKADVGLQVSVTDMGGWDTHVNQGNHKGQLADRFKELSESIDAFLTDLGKKRDDVVLVTMTEFGRTMKENGNRGTDHGHGSVMMVTGGPVFGKRVCGQWKDLSKGNLFEERDVPIVTDFRDVLGEILKNHLGVSNFASVFPKYDVIDSKFVKVLRA
jgi:uncharacterized protein (DUF1501 family)